MQRLRIAIPLLFTALLVSITVVPLAVAGVFTPESSSSPNAATTESLYKFVLIVAAIVFVLVEGLLFYTAFKYRKRHRSRQAAKITGNPSLEIAWTAGAAAILVLLAVVTFIKLDKIENPPGSKIPEPSQVSSEQAQPAPAVNTPVGNRLKIDVTGQQFLWKYTYPNGTFSFYEMVVPEDTVIVLNVKSADVAHSWWIPKLGGKRDALPGYRQSTWFKVDQPSSFTGQCAELCGAHHANMGALVRVVTKSEYEAWLLENQQDIQEAQKDLRKLKAEFGNDPSNGA